MGTRVNLPVLQGFGIPHEASLDAEAIAPDLSSYSQAGGLPGLVIPDRPGTRLLPRVHNAQGAQIEVTVQRSGMPGATLHANVSVDGSDPMGWSPPDLLQHAWGLPWPGTTMTSWSVVTVTGSTFLIAALADGTNVRVLRFDGSEWTPLIPSQPMEHASEVALVELPGGRLLLGCCDATGASLYYSDDLGESWSLYASDVWTELPTAAPAHVSMARMGDAILWLVGDTDDVLWQYASSDQGTTWRKVDSGADLGRAVSCYTLPDGSGIGVTYLSPTPIRPYYLRLASPWHSVRGPIPTLIEATTILGGLGALQDPNGALYVLAGAEGITWRSTDGGETWERTGNIWWDSGGINGSYLSLRGCAYAGGAAILGTPANTGPANTQVTHLQVGGWTNVVPRGGWNGAYTWAGWRDLTLDGFSFSGTASRTTEADGAVTIASGGTLGSGYFHLTPSAGTGLGMLFELSVPEASDSFRGLRIYRSADGVGIRALNFHADTASLTINNVGGGGNLAELEADLTRPMQLLINLDDLHLQVWYRRPGIFSTWSMLYDGEIEIATGLIPNNIRFGNFSSSAGSVRVRMLAYSESPLDLDELPGAYLTPEPLALPHAASGATMAYISAIGGPGVKGETYTITPRYAHGLDNALVGINPSPSEGWRAADTSEQVITWDLEDETWVGNAFYLVIERANFRTAYLEGSVDGETWSTLATYDAATGFTGLGWTQAGLYMKPTGATNGARYLQPGELVGGHVLYGDGTCTRIVHQYAGHWTINATERAKLRVADAKAGTGTDMALVAPGGLAIGYADEERTYRYVRIRIPSQPCPDDRFRAALLSWGRIELAGQETSWGWSQRGGPNYASALNDWGTEFRRTRGPVGREWTFSWADGAGVGSFRTNPSAPYIAASDSSPPLATVGNVWWLLTGLLAETAYTRPVVWCNSLPGTSTTLTDRTRWICGYLSGDVQIDGNLGTEGVDEHGRISNLTITELR